MVKKTTTTTTTTVTSTTITSGGSQHDYILIDRSGSMATIWSDTLGGVNAYVHGLAKDPATTDILVTVAAFDDQDPFLVLRKNVLASEWKNISDTEVSPRGFTPLFDSIGRLVAVAREDNPDKAAIIIQTDGQENRSREHTKASAKALLDSCRDKNWQVIFLGANFDNMNQGLDLGNTAASTMSYDARNTVSVMGRTSRMRSAYATGISESMAYSAEDKKDAVTPQTKTTN